MISSRLAPAVPGVAARRRAADVVVLGDSLQAYAAAYLLAKRGRRAVLVSLPPQVSPTAPAQDDVVLHLPAATPHLVNEATEALALWRGVEAASGARDLLQLCGSLDVAAGGGGPGADALQAMQEASQAAGLPLAMLAADEVTAAYPRLRPPRRSSCLFTQLGGVVQGSVAAAALRAMAQRAGADLAPRAAPRRLLGWRDAGSHFAVRTVALGGDEVVFECEQLLLLPEAAAQRPALALFGLAVPGAALWEAPAARWAAQEECAGLPVWQLLSSGSSRTLDDPWALDSCWGLPPLGWRGTAGGMLVAHSLAGGRLEAAEAQAQARHSAAGSAAGDEQQRQQRERQEDPIASAAAALAGGAPLETADLADGGLVERPGSEEAIDAELARLAEQQRQQQREERRLAASGRLAAALVAGVGGRLPDGEAALRCVVTPDGEPGVGSHPAAERGRLVVGFPAAAAALGCLPGDQLAPLVARLAVAELLGQGYEGVDAARVALGREALGAEATPLHSDSWEEMLAR